MSLVVDASVTMAWCFEDEVTPFSEAALDAVVATGARVPSIWGLEVINVLLVGERRGRITKGQSSRFLDRLLSLPIEVEPAFRRADCVETLALGRAQNLSAYDAAYLELAVRLDFPLATQDTALARAAETAGVTLFRS